MAVNPRALVIGGGLAGLTAALSIAQHGFEVHLMERSAELGGNLKHIYHTLEGSDTQTLLENITSQVKVSHPIHLSMETEVVEVSGYAGNFAVSLRDKDSCLHSWKWGPSLSPLVVRNTVPRNISTGKASR